MLRRLILGFLLAVALAVSVVRIARTPSNLRVWHPHQQVLPRVTVRGDLVEVRNVRDFIHRSEGSFERRYVDRVYDLRKLRSASYVVSRFGSVPGLAHAFLTFDFDGDYVCVSVEARKEADESYSPLRGLLNEYELMYVIGSERDIIGIRTNIWKEAVTLYPVRTTPQKLRQAFLGMVTRAEELARRPESYDTLTNSCNSNIVRHVNAISPGRIRFDLRTVLPGFSDRLAWELGLIDSTRPLEEVRELYRIDKAAQSVPLDENFSRAIRAGLPKTPR